MKNEWRVFINEMIKHGNKVKAYKKAYPSSKSDNAIRANSVRLIKNDNILKAIKAGSEKASKIASDKAINTASDIETSNLLSSIEKRSILARIARGEEKVQENSVTKDGIVITYLRNPNANEKMKAIETDNRMTGDNAPDKIDHQGGINVIFDEFIEE